MALSEYWSRITPRTRRALLVGSVGPEHLDATAAMAAEEGQGELALELQLAAWEHYPLDGVFAAKVLERGVAAATPMPRELLECVRKCWQVPDDAGDLQRLARDRQFEQAWELVCSRAEAEGDNLFWCAQLQVLGMMTGRSPDGVERILCSPAMQAEGLAPLDGYLRGEQAFAAGNYTAAQEHYGLACKHPQATGWLTPLERRAEACWRLGWRDRALQLWKQVIEARPWHLNLILRVHAAVLPLEDVGTLPATAVLVYSFNKAEYLDATLEALAKSRGVAMIVALDNGSSDATPEVLRSWRERLGDEFLKTVRLPVNIGAPAARNWLAAVRELDEMECAAYLDDDALPPVDWLESLHAARQAFPGATAWGCRVMDHVAPEIIQSADLHLGLATSSDGLAETPLDPFRANAEPFRISELHAQVADRGQFDYVRPCVSVTGCCHLLDMAQLRETGFDLRYTPSQYDDLDRDLREAMAGRLCCYHGGVAVSHRKRSGRAAAMDTRATGNWLGNRYKLLNRFSAEELASLWRSEEQALQDDMDNKLPELESLLGFPGLGERL